MKRTEKILTRLAMAAFVLAGMWIAPAQTVKHVTTQEAMDAATSKPVPEYSAMARQLKVQGQVSVNVYISEEGKVERVETVTGNPMLLKCAEDGVRRWKFAPFLEDGKPVKATATLSFNFKL